MRIHTFLEKEGIINFCVSKDGNYNFSNCVFSRILNEQPKSALTIDKVGDED